jgi:CheY-like chemotaxis protein
MTTCQGCILIAEDDPDLREALGDYIASLGCKVLLAVDGVEALERLAPSVTPCVIVTDLNMPRLDGAGLVRSIRANGHRGTPIITMSAGSQGAKPANVAAHLDKPFACADLDSTVARLCRGGPACRHGVGLVAPIDDE